MPGFGRSLTTKTRNLVASHTHVFGNSLLNELRVGWMTVDGGQVSLNRGDRLRRAGSVCSASRATRATSAFRRSRPAGSSARWAIRRSSRPATTSTSSCSTTSRSTAARTASSSARYYFHLQLRPEQPDNAARRLHLHRAVHRQRLRRLPARLSDVGHLGHRPRRRGRPHQLAASLRPGRLAGARQPDVQRRPALRIQPAHVRREQPPVVDRPVDAGRPLRHRQRRATATIDPSAPGAAAADSDSRT